MKTRTASPCFIALLIACFAFFPTAQAVITDPEGYFPGFNTAEGQGALYSLTTGLYNTALGGAALYSNTTGNSNTAVGLNALFHNTTGFNNTALGPAALYYNTTGDQNTATGYAALRSNTTGDGNTANGYQALYFNTTGVQNTANGAHALERNTTGYQNTATGSAALRSNITGNWNTANGHLALHSNTTGSYNTANGYQTLFDNTTGNQNTASGFHALYSNTTGNFNTANGNHALERNTTGGANTAIGELALANNTTGIGNIAVQGGLNVTTADHVICIGTNGQNVSNSCYIANIWQQPGGSQAVYVNVNGKLGALVSSRHFKDEIKPMEKASEVIYGLQPVRFRYKAEIEPSRPLSFGLIAEDVEKINADLVTRDRDGKPNSVRYDAVNAMLLNEFLKEHRKVQELETNDAEQQREIKALVATVKEQAAQIQKVSAQIEISKGTPNVVLNNP